MGKGHRAIDGVKDPSPSAGPWMCAMFFTENGIGGEGVFDCFASEEFGGPICVGDDGSIVFHIDIVHTIAEGLEGEVTHGVGKSEGSTKSDIEAIDHEGMVAVRECLLAANKGVISTLRGLKSRISISFAPHVQYGCAQGTCVFSSEF